MPCKKCKDGKYKYGNTGECKYDTKEECDKANPNKYNKMKEYPTPLGKKTYDEYAKELKEFNLSAEPKLEKVELGAIDDIKKKLDKNITLFDKSVNEVRGMAKKFVDLEENFNKIMDEASFIRKQLSDLGVDDPKNLSFVSLKSKELAKLSREFIKDLR
jgi:hypothetical protein